MAIACRLRQPVLMERLEQGTRSLGWSAPPQVSSLSCNPNTLVFHRKRRKWTQSELASLSGYSQRLIVKAESGKPIHITTIEDLADTLSDEAYCVTPEDLITQPAHLAREFVFACYQFKAAALHKLEWFLSPNITVTFAGSPAVFPFAGTHRGLKQVQLAMQQFHSSLNVAGPEFDYRSAYTFVVNEQDPNEVIAWGESGFVGPRHESIAAIKRQWRLRFRSGQLYDVEDRFDTFQVKRILKDDIRTP